MVSTGTIYEELGVRPVVNAAGNATRLGGSILSPSVRAAMEAANQAYVDMDELLKATGREVAALLGAEAAFVTSGCAAALALGTAACITGGDVGKMERLPDTRGMRNRVVIQRGMRYKYDRCPTIVGGRLTVVGTVRATTREQLDRALGPRTACLLYLARAEGTPGVLSLDEAIALAHSKGVPVLVDAAAEVYPLDYFTSFIRRGADLVCYGAKYFGGPHSAGILCGRRELVEAAYIQNFIGFEATDYRTFGRPLKVDRQEVIGVVVALREWMTMDHEPRLLLHERRLHYIMERLKDLPHITLRKTPLRGPATRLAIDLDEAALGRTAQQVQAALRNGEPCVWVYTEGPSLLVATHTLRDGEEEVVARRLREELTRGGG
jgi:L-seryl-tRNA(Ser) seleniumtransferase